MTAAENKRLLQHLFAEYVKGNSRPFVEAMADDIVWTMPGSTTWSGVYEGKKAVIEHLFGSLRAEMERMSTLPHRFIADDDFVVVEAKGDNLTKSGKPYRNTYCMIYRVEGGRLKEVTEYMDTELVTKTLSAPKYPPKPLPIRA